MAHPNDSVAHLIGTQNRKHIPKPQPKTLRIGIEVNGHEVPYSKETTDRITNGDVQGVAQMIRGIEYEGAKSKGHSTDDLEKPRGLGVRTNSEDFVAGDED